MSETSYPVKTTSCVAPGWLREDLPRERASEYWAGPHAEIVRARDLRTYTLLPYSRFMYATPGVSHDNPPAHRYHGAVVFGSESRAAVDTILGSGPVAAIIAEQDTVLTAVQAYAVERSVPAKRIDNRVA